MAKNGEAVYGSERCDLHGGMIGLWTKKGQYAYLHVFRWPGAEAVVPLVSGNVVSAELLGEGEGVSVRQEHNGRLVLHDLPIVPPDPNVNVIKIQFEGKFGLMKEKDKAAWLG